MSYAATWTNANPAGQIEPGLHWIARSDEDELAQAINRRRLLTYQSEETFTASQAVETAPLIALREQIVSLLSAPTGSLGGSPATPELMDWLWPVDDGDEDKTVVASPAGAGEVNLFDKLNGASGWTDPSVAGGDSVRAVHCNEPRQAIEWQSRGRWELPIYFSAGIFSMLPDTPWLGEHIANNGSDELRAMGFAMLRDGTSPTLGLTNVSARASSQLEITADTDCQIEIYHCIRPLDFTTNTPTWNQHLPPSSWASPGGLGSGDTTNIGSMTLSAGVAGTLSTSALQSTLQNMIDGQEQNLLVRRSDTGYETINITGKIRVDFDLDTPPN